MRIDLSVTPLMLNGDNDDTASFKNVGDIMTTELCQMESETKPTRRPMFSMKIIQLDRCQEKNDHYHYNYYRGRSIVVEEEQVPVLSLRQKTSLFGILLIICQFATVDTYQFLPLGAILYALGIGCALELIQEHPDAEIEFVLPWHELSLLQKIQEQQRRRQQQRQRQRLQPEEPQQPHYPTDDFLLERLQETVNFEYQVLQGFARAPRVVAREEAGTVVYYTV